MLSVSCVSCMPHAIINWESSGRGSCKICRTLILLVCYRLLKFTASKLSSCIGRMGYHNLHAKWLPLFFFILYVLLYSVCWWKVTDRCVKDWSTCTALILHMLIMMWSPVTFLLPVVKDKHLLQLWWILEVQGLQESKSVLVLRRYSCRFVSISFWVFLHIR